MSDNTQSNLMKAQLDFMDKFTQGFTEEEEREMWNDLTAIVRQAKLCVIEDAERNISNLRTFSLM